MESRAPSPEDLATRGVALSYWPGRDMPRDHDHCFLCGVALTVANRTDEHVFPRWLLRAFGLWDVRLTLPNLTPIPYRQLRIPCCTDCNNFWLSRVELEVSKAFGAGSTAVAGLDASLLWLWLAKIYYGLRFKELALPADRRDPSGPAIVEPQTLGRLSELHHVLQAATGRVHFPRAPGSLRVFRAQVPIDQEKRFDFRDLQAAPYLAIRVGPTVVVSALLDWGAMERLHEPYFDIADQLELHPLQFHEVAAYGAYISLRFSWRFAYRVIPPVDHDEIEPVRVGVSGTDPRHPAFTPFVLERMAVVLADFMRWPVRDLYRADPPGLWSTLLTADGRPYTLDLDAVPPDALMPPSKWLAAHAEEAATLIDIR